MKKLMKFIRSNKLFSILIFIILFSLICSLIFLFMLDDESIKMMNESINIYFSNINNKNVDYFNNFKISIINNFSISLIIWLLGISIVGSFLIILIFFINCFSSWLSFISIISVYGFKGIIHGIIYMISYFINMVVLFIISYYGISFSILLFKYLFNGLEISRKSIIKRYILLLVYCLIILMISSLIDVFLVPRILLLF